MASTDTVYSTFNSKFRHAEFSKTSPPYLQDLGGPSLWPAPSMNRPRRPLIGKKRLVQHLVDVFGCSSIRPENSPNSEKNIFWQFFYQGNRARGTYGKLWRLPQRAAATWLLACFVKMVAGAAASAFTAAFICLQHDRCWACVRGPGKARVRTRTLQDRLWGLVLLANRER